ncbi:DUF4267 domain-containing protein [Amycolatopsis sp. PS_44_ISF1]|uniref:DUF4267 domain-containing protein n=1 Tax=Amycolatopsis sp. PS_44_ISF1 TaxID=2974917 RepID=UPI0028DF4846|nr:DUF4267 domain-containing protein [Amycolatopsis sp. PS_44_ISF1]MDT8915339.1 DUF4267 domain-containing protein [Amycolatopsis sp. PS_44_ISF1]
MLLVGYLLAGLAGTGIIYVGLGYLFAPEKSAKTFGLPAIPTGTPAFFQLKGVRDIGSGLVVGAAVLSGGPSVVGWVLLAEAFIPFGDLLVVLRHRGSRAMAFGVHGLTGAVLVVATLLLVLG